jgi:hypothetical protein
MGVIEGTAKSLVANPMIQKVSVEFKKWYMECCRWCLWGRWEVTCTGKFEGRHVVFAIKDFLPSDTCKKIRENYYF